jgi:hypothetical protein
MILDDIDVLATLIRHSRPSFATGVDICSFMNLHASLHARLDPVQDQIIRVSYSFSPAVATLRREDVPVTSDDGGRVDLVLDELVGSSKELGSEQDDRGRSISDLLILLLGERDEDSGLEARARESNDERRGVKRGVWLTWAKARRRPREATNGRVGDFEELEDSSSVVGDGDILWVAGGEVAAVGDEQRSLHDREGKSSKPSMRVQTYADVVNHHLHVPTVISSQNQTCNQLTSSFLGAREREGERERTLSRPTGPSDDLTMFEMV